MFGAGAKTVAVEQVENPCQRCGGGQIGKMHFSAEGRPEMMVVRCLKCGAEKRLYSGRREPRYAKGYYDAVGVKERKGGT